MAGKAGSPLGFLFLDGYNLTGAKPKSITLGVTSITEKTSGVGDVNEFNDPVGVQAGTFAQSGAYFDTTQNGIHAAMANKLPSGPEAAARIGCMGVFGQVVGALFYGFANLVTTTYGVLVTIGALTKADVKYVISALIERGQIIQPLSAETANWDTSGTPADYAADPSQPACPITSNSVANPTVITTPIPHNLSTGDVVLISGVAGSTPTINGQFTATVIDALHFSVALNVTIAGTGGQFVRASSHNGGAGYQQVTAFAGFTGYVGKLRHSPDGVTFADLCTFANVTAGPAADREVIAGTINRYVDHQGVVTGAGSLTAFSGLTRS